MAGDITSPDIPSQGRNAQPLPPAAPLSEPARNRAENPFQRVLDKLNTLGADLNSGRFKSSNIELDMQTLAEAGRQIQATLAKLGRDFTSIIGPGGRLWKKPDAAIAEMFENESKSVRVKEADKEVEVMFIPLEADVDDIWWDRDHGVWKRRKINNDHKLTPATRLELLRRLRGETMDDSTLVVDGRTGLPNYRTAPEAIANAMMVGEGCVRRWFPSIDPSVGVSVNEYGKPNKFDIDNTTFQHQEGFGTFLAIKRQAFDQYLRSLLPEQPK